MVDLLTEWSQSNQFAEYRSLIGAFRSLLRTNGIRGLFQGFTATAVRDAPYAGLSLTFYEKAKDVTGEYTFHPVLIDKGVKIWMLMDQT